MPMYEDVPQPMLTMISMGHVCADCRALVLGDTYWHDQFHYEVEALRSE